MKKTKWHMMLRKTFDTRAEAEAMIANPVARGIIAQCDREILNRKLAEGFRVVGRPYFGRYKIVDDTAHPITVAGRGRFWVERRTSAWITPCSPAA